MRGSRSSNQLNSAISTTKNITNDPSSKFVADLLADVEPGTGVSEQKPKLRPLRLSLLADKPSLSQTNIDSARGGNANAPFLASYLRRPDRTASILTTGLLVTGAAAVAVCGLIDSSRVRTHFSFDCNSFLFPSSLLRTFSFIHIYFRRKLLSPMILMLLSSGLRRGACLHEPLFLYLPFLYF